MHENNISLLCEEAKRLLQLNIHLLTRMIDEPKVLVDSKQGCNEQLFSKDKAEKRIKELKNYRVSLQRFSVKKWCLP